MVSQLEGLVVSPEPRLVSCLKRGGLVSTETRDPLDKTARTSLYGQGLLEFGSEPVA
jgi:hypothetical protein